MVTYLYTPLVCPKKCVSCSDNTQVFLFFLPFALYKGKNRTMYCAIFEDLEISVGDVGSIVEGAAPHKLSQEGGGRYGIERHRGEIRNEFA